MFQSIATHAKFVDSFGEEKTPVVTLKEGKNGRLCHITVDEDCYVVYLWASDLGYVPTPYIFPEAREALSRLPQLTVQ